MSFYLQNCYWDTFHFVSVSHPLFLWNYPFYFTEFNSLIGIDWIRMKSLCEMKVKNNDLYQALSIILNPNLSLHCSN